MYIADFSGNSCTMLSWLALLDISFQHVTMSHTVSDFITRSTRPAQFFGACGIEGTWCARLVMTLYTQKETNFLLEICCIACKYFKIFKICFNHCQMAITVLLNYNITDGHGLVCMQKLQWTWVQGNKWYHYCLRCHKRGTLSYRPIKSLLSCHRWQEGM